MFRTLLVDDNEDFRNTLFEYVQSQADLNVIGQADSGKEALFKAQLLKPDLILMDISMNGMDGFKSARLIKEKLPATKIIFLTVHREETYRYLAAMVEADGFIWKYSLKDDLPKRIAKLRDKEIINTKIPTRPQSVNSVGELV